MSRSDATRILGWLEDRRPEMVDLLERLARVETPSLVPTSVVRAHSILADEFQGAGFHVRRLRGHEAGDHLYARPARRLHGGRHQLVVGHLDTVWPVGTLAEMPVEQRNGTLHGPGVYDMKAGLVQLVFALRALDAAGLVPSVTPTIVVNSDEEIGSRDSSRFIRLLAHGAVRAFVLEPPAGSTGELKTSRKGIGRFTLKVHGRASHAGTDFDEGVSAILELSYQVQRLFALNDPVRGVTVNVGTIDGGLRPNVVAPAASALIDVRVPNSAAARDVDAAIRGLQPMLDGSSLEIEGGIGRPPMEPLPGNRALFRRAKKLAAELGFEVEEAELVGGGSDANTTSRFTPTLDGLGAVGAGAHAADEHVAVASLAERAALLALLLLEPSPSPQRPFRRARRRYREPCVAVLGGNAQMTNGALVAAWRDLGIPARLLSPFEARGWLQHDDVVLGRLDVLRTLDGIEPGLLEMLLLERAGHRVLNPAEGLLAAHDKLLTARRLAEAALPHPITNHLAPGGPFPDMALPVVVKPRFGSWGIDVYRCDSPRSLDSCLAEVRDRRWFRRHGALIQELVPPVGYDLRLLVAAEEVVGAIERIARPGDWRTNISLGGTRRPARPSPEACELAVAAAASIGADLVGVDLLPLTGGGYSILELNGAVDFSSSYALDQTDIYARVANALNLPRATVATSATATSW